MDMQIALLLGQDGIVNGAVYGLMALALVLVFSVTRVIFIPQGEFVAFGALSMAALQAGRVPATLWLLLALAAAALAVEALALEARRDGGLGARRWSGCVAAAAAWPARWCCGCGPTSLVGAGARRAAADHAARARCCTGWPTGRWPMRPC